MIKSELEPNQAQSKLWNSRAGEAWVAQQAMLDRLFLPFEQVLADAVRDGDAREVLDIGCGAGATTLAAARQVGERGRCVGVDLSNPLIEAARRRAVASDARNASFFAADAQQYEFEPDRFDALISRFGVMFFDDPVAAFANLRQAARTGAGLTFIAWRSAGENPFMTAAERAAAPLMPELPPRDPDAPGQFAFADAERVGSILTASGWEDVDIRPLDVACSISEDDLEAYITRMGPVGLLLPTLEEPRRGPIAAAVRQAFEAHRSEESVEFVAACWLIRARNP